MAFKTSAFLPPPLMIQSRISPSSAALFAQVTICSNLAALPFFVEPKSLLLTNLQNVSRNSHKKKKEAAAEAMIYRRHQLLPAQSWMTRPTRTEASSGVFFWMRLKFKPEQVLWPEMVSVLL